MVLVGSLGFVISDCFVRRAKSRSAMVSPSVLVVDKFGAAGLFSDPGGLPLPLEVACLAYGFLINFADEDVGRATASGSIGFLDKASALTFNLPGLWINLY